MHLLIELIPTVILYMLDEPNPFKQFLSRGFQYSSLLLALTLLIFSILAGAIHLIARLNKKPVPRRPLDVARPKPLRFLLIGFAILMAPLIVIIILPIETMNQRSALVLTYLLEIPIGVAFHFILNLYYKTMPH